MDKEYTGTCYIGVVGGEIEIGECRDSIEMIRRRPGDTRPIPIRGTKGYEVRELHIERWLNETDYPFALLLDHDMIFPPDTLERLRDHKLPFVSGYYLRRRYSPIAPVWFEPFTEWPYKPFTADPERGKLHPLGASGWGCMLIHREIMEKVRPLLRGEGFVIEDDMDVWPYDVSVVLKIIELMRNMVSVARANIPDGLTIPIVPANSISDYIDELENEFRVLRGTKDPVGSDIRFPFFALQAGYQLYGDPDVRCRHMLNYPLTPDDYGNWPDEEFEEQKATILKGFWVERKRMRDVNKLASGKFILCPRCKSIVARAAECSECGGAL